MVVRNSNPEFFGQGFPCKMKSTWRMKEEEDILMMLTLRFCLIAKRLIKDHDLLK